MEGFDPDTEGHAYTLEEAVEMAKGYRKEGSPASMAAKTAAADTGFKKGDIYKLLQEEKDNA